MPEEQLNLMGAQAFENVKQKTPLEENSQVNGYVNCIASSVIKVSGSATRSWEVAVFREDTANAFALPGGKVGVYTGMLNVAKNQHQLATVISHEIAHVLANHGNERVSQEFALEQGVALAQSALGNPQTEKGQFVMGLLGVGIQFGILLPYSRTQESEADLLGLKLMANAGFDPRESVQLWRNMSQGSNNAETPEFMSTHPSHTTRITDLNREMNQSMMFYQQALSKGASPQCG